VSWYDFREDGDDPFYHEHHFGLIRNVLTPKIGYKALAAVGQLLGKAEFERAVQPADGLTALQFRTAHGRVIAAWAKDRTRLIGWKIEGDTVRVLNALGEPAVVYDDRGTIVVRMERGLPVFFLSSGFTDLAAVDWPVAIGSARSAYHPGDTVSFEVAGLNANTTVAIDRAPHGWKAARCLDGLNTLMIPENARPGKFEVRFRVKTQGQRDVVLPVEIRVAPLLVRG
jgi:hypothetical protein